MTDAPRVASFVPSATEWMYALGLEDRLVGVTFECDVPARAKTEKPWVVRNSLEDQDLTAAEIHEVVSRTLRERHSLYRLDADALRAADPDVILAQRLCDVCAASNHEVEEAARILGRRPRVVPLAPHRLEDVWADAQSVAEAAGAPDRGAPLAERLRARVDAVREAVRDRERPRAVFLEWTDPPMCAGHWIPDLVDAAGGHDPLGRPGEKSVQVTWDDVAAGDPDVLLVAPCGFDLDRAEREAEAVRKRFPDTRVVALDAFRLFSRSGPGVAACVEALAGVLHPVVPSSSRRG